ncbi:MAG: hypothetical protein KGL90_05885 [Burkholderiales bacterium]|nr:hypothetical protein [Burkholderiales bacterium]
MKRMTTQEFVHRAREVHGEIYDYSNATYKSAKDKVRVLCPQHGEFFTPAGHHLSGTGCPQCGLVRRASARKSNLENFIKNAIEKHGNYYDYSEAIYTGSKQQIRIICPVHGAFLQTAGNHLTGFGCPACGRIRTEESRKLHANEFFERCIEAHQGRYFYPEQPYDGPNSIISVICPDHGLFLAGARNHLWNKRRCPKCARVISGALRRIPKDDWLQLAISVHGERYEYNLSNYSGGSEAVSIKCQKHGFFRQRGHKHLAGQGCPKCARERLIGRWQPDTLSDDFANEPCSFYYMHFTDGEESFYKVGISNDVDRRKRTLETSGYTITLLHVKNGTRRECLESEIAVFQAYDQVAGYVPKRPFAGSSECFATDVLGLHA